jgi:hypothetical protein
MDVGRRGTNGLTVLENAGPEPAVLDRVSFRKRTRGLKILGLFVVRARDLPGPGFAAGAIDGFPPRVTQGILHPVRGFEVRPYRGRGDAVELIVGFVPTREGALSYQGVDVYYHVGKKRYVAFRPDAFAVCAPRSFPPPHCNAPGH